MTESGKDPVSANCLFIMKELPVNLLSATEALPEAMESAQFPIDIFIKVTIIKLE
jgi:hypothetical protein